MVQFETMFESLEDPVQVMQNLGPEVMEKVLKGFTQSLFGGDVQMKLTMGGPPQTTQSPWQSVLASSGGNASWPNVEVTIPANTPGTPDGNADPATAVDVDLHKCIDGNVDIFKHAWGPIVGAAEQFMEGKCGGTVYSLCLT